MLKEIKQATASLFNSLQSRNIPIHWIKHGESSWLCNNIYGKYLKSHKSLYSSRIERLAQETNNSGAQKLWDGYGENNIAGSTRMPNAVRTAANMGNLYTYLVRAKKPKVIVEFGSAFGVSGMYFTAGLNINNNGVLLTFEPNSIWAKFAKNNLSQISDRFSLTIGTFEEHIDHTLPAGQLIDIAFIDAIHTRQFVEPQLNLVYDRCNSGALIILDDINFSNDMREYWNDVSVDSRFTSSLELGNRVGVLEAR